MKLTQAKRSFAWFIMAAATLPMAGCVAAEIVAAPVLAPVMVAGQLYYGSHEGRSSDWRKPHLDVLGAPGNYQFFTGSVPVATAQLTVDADHSIKLEGFNCTLAGSPRSDLSRQAPRDWRPGQVYQVTSATGTCSSAAGSLVYIQVRLHLAGGVKPENLPFGNNIALSLWSARCCSMTVLSLDYRPWPDFVRAEARPG